MFPEDTVLVVLMNNPRDLAIARDQHWYRIPVKHAPKNFQADYLAFYLARAFGENKWAIHEYAAVRGHELVTRRDLLPDEPDHPRAGEHYYKLQLGSLIKLPRPIISRRGRRLLFITTTWAKFTRAEEINDLILSKSSAEERLWITLKEEGIAAERHMVLSEGRALYRTDLAVFCQEGQVGVVCEGETTRRPRQGERVPRHISILRFPAEQLEGAFAECVDAIRHAISERGGVAKERIRI